MVVLGGQVVKIGGPVKEVSKNPAVPLGVLQKCKSRSGRSLEASSAC